MAKKVVFIYGPETIKKKGAYGGGVGGYTRNMKVYLENFIQMEDYTVLPAYHTVRGSGIFNNFLVRFIIDTFRYLKSLILHRPSIVHILGIYDTAIPRELMVVILSKLFGVKIVYEVKAGVFITCYNKTNWLFRKMVHWTIDLSDTILSEGNSYLPYIEKKFNRKAHFFPNIVPDSEVPSEIAPKLQDKELKILFVGYCYKGKGVYELIEACITASKDHETPIKVTLIGKEAEDFTEWLSQQSLDYPLLNIVRMGVQPHTEVINQFNQHDIYCYPSYHQGEGHNNSINEAMMMGMVIISSKAGFLEDVLGNECAYLLDDITPNSILDSLMQIQGDRKEAIQKSQNAYKKLKENYTTSIAIQKVEKYYQELLRS